MYMHAYIGDLYIDTYTYIEIHTYKQTYIHPPPAKLHPVTARHGLSRRGP